MREFDPFGVEKKYPTKNGGQEWYMNVNNPDDGQISFRGKARIKNNYWIGTPDTEMNPISFRIVVHAMNGNHTTTADHSLAASRGYMASPNDFRNVEMTEYHCVVEATDRNEEMTHYCRGGNHTESNHGCTGTAYKPGIKFTGNPVLRKEYWHNDGYWSASNIPKLGENPGSIIGKWIGQKSCVYDLTKGNVKIEVYYDLLDGDPSHPINNWVKYFEYEDDGTNMFGKDNERDINECNPTSPGMVFRWGGPEVTFRIDKIKSVNIKWASVREIQQPV